MHLDEQLYARYERHWAMAKPPTPEQYDSFARHYARVFLPWLPPDRNAPILDVGCGSGHFLYFLSREGYANVRGIDVSAGNVAVCSSRVTTRVEQAEALAYLQGHPSQFAAIVLIDVLEHVPDQDLLPLMDAVRNALLPGGRLLVSVPNAACLPTLVTRYGDLTHKRLFTEWSLVQLLDAGGLIEIAIHPNEKPVVRSFRSRRERLLWRCRDRFVRWLLRELHLHLMEGAEPRILAVNLLAVARRQP